MGGSVKDLFKSVPVVSTAVSLLSSSDEQKYYKQMAQVANLQADQVLASNKRQADYVFKSAAQQSSELARDYSTLLSQQKTALAASGLGSNSATTQAILKNSKFNALQDEEALQYNLNTTLYENNTAASLEALNLRLRANQYNKIRQNIKTSTLMSSIGGIVSNYATKKF